MELTFSEMSVDTTLAQEYLKKNEVVLQLYNNYNETIKQFKNDIYDGKEWKKFCYPQTYIPIDIQKILLNMASSLKQSAPLIMQLEYHIRNIPIEDTKAQLSLLIKYLQSTATNSMPFTQMYDFNWIGAFNANDSLLVFGNWMERIHLGTVLLESRSRETAAICHLIVTLLHNAGKENVILRFIEPLQEHLSKKQPVGIADIVVEVEDSHLCSGLDSGTVAVVSEDADVDSAVDKFISVSKQVPWRLRRILVQESVYQQFKDALSWKCNLNKSRSKPQTSGVLCSNTLIYNDRTFLIDPVELTEGDTSVVTVEAYRTTKEMIDLVQQDEPHYLSLWTNVIAEINEVTHSTKAPVVWVNNIADFRGPLQVSEAVFSSVHATNTQTSYRIKKCAKVAKLCELSQSWLKLDLETRRDILCGVLDKYILLDPTNKLYTEIKKTLSCWTLNSFVDVGKDYVCIGTLQPHGIIKLNNEEKIFSVEQLTSILQGNALIVSEPEEQKDIAVLEQAGVPVAYVKISNLGTDFKIFDSRYVHPTRTRVIWTNSGTIFAN